MYKYAIKSMETDLLDCSTYEERNYITGDSEIILHKWDTKPTIRYFEESRASIKMSGLPPNIQDLYSHFEKAVMEYLIQLK